MGDFDEKAKANADQIRAEIRSLASIYGDCRANRHFGVFWGQVKQVSDMFKTVKPLRREDRELLWTEFDALCEAAKKEQEGFDKESKANAKAIESELGSLASGHWAGLMQRDYGAFWGHVKHISHMFKTLKPLRREDRERLWQEFNGLCEETKSKQHDENKNRKFKSEQHRSDILEEAERARPCSLFGFMPPDVEEMKALGRVLKDAGLLLSKYKSEMLGEHKQECFAAIQDVRRAQDAWWEMLKGHRAQRHQDFQSRVRANISANYERLRTATDALERWRRNADNLRDIISSTSNDSHREKASGWLSEAEDKIRDIEESIERIESWIHEDEQKLIS
jgi:hypothetical protein